MTTPTQANAFLSEVAAGMASLRTGEIARLRAANAALTEALWGCVAAMERTQHIDEAGRIAAADAARVVLSSLEG